MRAMLCTERLLLVQKHLFLLFKDALGYARHRRKIGRDSVLIQKRLLLLWLHHILLLLSKVLLLLNLELRKELLLM